MTWTRRYSGHGNQDSTRTRTIDTDIERTDETLAGLVPLTGSSSEGQGLLPDQKLSHGLSHTWDSKYLRVGRPQQDVQAAVQRCPGLLSSFVLPKKTNTLSSFVMDDGCRRTKSLNSEAISDR